jgi:hypothetical protein
LKNWRSARCIRRSRSPLVIFTGFCVIGSSPVWYMQAAMSNGLGMKSCTWSGL